MDCQLSTWPMVRFNRSAGPRRLFGFTATSIGKEGLAEVMMPVLTMTRASREETTKLLLSCSGGVMLIVTVWAMFVILSCAASTTDAVRSLGGMINVKDGRSSIAGEVDSSTVNVLLSTWGSSLSSTNTVNKAEDVSAANIIEETENLAVV